MQVLTFNIFGLKMTIHAPNAFGGILPVNGEQSHRDLQKASLCTGARHTTCISLRSFYPFWATVCKTVRSMLSDRCPVCLPCLSVTLVYCG